MIEWLTTFVVVVAGSFAIIGFAWAIGSIAQRAGPLRTLCVGIILMAAVWATIGALVP